MALRPLLPHFATRFHIRPWELDLLTPGEVDTFMEALAVTAPDPTV